MFLKSDDIQPLVNLARFLVAPPLKDCKFGKSLKHLVFRDFLFPLIRIFRAKERTSAVINNQSKQINALYQIHQRDYKKLLQLIQLYSELSACGVMDSKRKESLKTEINNLVNT